MGATHDLDVERDFAAQVEGNCATCGDAAVTTQLVTGNSLRYDRQCRRALLVMVIAIAAVYGLSLLFDVEWLQHFLSAGLVLFGQQSFTCIFFYIAFLWPLYRLKNWAGRRVGNLAELAVGIFQVLFWLALFTPPIQLAEPYRWPFNVFVMAVTLLPAVLTLLHHLHRVYDLMPQCVACTSIAMQVQIVDFRPLQRKATYRIRLDSPVPESRNSPPRPGASEPVVSPAAWELPEAQP